MKKQLLFNSTTGVPALCEYLVVDPHLDPASFLLNPTNLIIANNKNI